MQSIGVWRERERVDVNLQLFVKATEWKLTAHRAHSFPWETMVLLEMWGKSFCVLVKRYTPIVLDTLLRVLPPLVQGFLKQRSTCYIAQSPVAQTMTYNAKPASKGSMQPEGHP